MRSASTKFVFRARSADGAAAPQASDEEVDLVAQVLVVDDAIDNADAQRLVGVELVGQEVQLPGLGRADEAAQRPADHPCRRPRRRRGRRC